MTAAKPGRREGAPYLRAKNVVSDLGYRYSVVWALLVVVLVFSVLEPDSFFTFANLQSILGSQAVLLLIALGLTVPLAANEFDLSVGAMAGFSQVIVGALTVNEGWPLLAALLVTLGVCLTIGVLNAVFVIKVGINSFITTLAMGSVLTGVALKMTDASIILDLPRPLITAAATQFLGIQLVFWYALAATIVIWYVLTWTPTGRWIYFTGASPDVARLNGVRADAIRGGSLVFSAFVACVAGILYGGVFGTADPNAGAQFLLPAFAAAFLGATAFTPGRFNAWGTTVSVYLVITGIVGLSMATGESGWLSFVFNGAILIAAVAAQRTVATRRARRESRSIKGVDSDTNQNVEGARDETAVR